MSNHLYIPDLHSLHERGHYALISSIAEADKNNTLCPPTSNIFKAFHLSPLENTKVVILGQDPYHTPGKASGIAFGYRQGYDGPIDSSLYNIMTEVANDMNQAVTDITLESWAKQGVLLLNTRLTTEQGRPLAHKGLGWEEEIGYFLERLGDSIGPHVYMLWGKEAQGYRKYINSKYNLVLETSHPCKFSAHRGFLGCKHFSQANQWLKDNGREEIIWGEV